LATRVGRDDKPKGIGGTLSGKEKSSELTPLLTADWRCGLTVPRTERNRQGEFVVREYDTFCPKVLAELGRLADTVEDHAITFVMQRKRDDEQVMRCKTLHRRNGIPLKVLSRLLWHPSYQMGYPVRLRTASNITHPTVRFNSYWLDVRLPMEQGRYIRLLARLVRQWRNGQRQNETPTPKAKGAPTNGTRPVSTAKPTPTNGTRQKPKARPKPPKSKPAWQQEWDALWEKVAQALWGNEQRGDQ